MPDLLIELFSEEIPARMQARAAEDLKKLVADGLVEAGLTYEGAVAFATPRRLTLHVAGLPAASPDTREERKGPRVGSPDKAVEGFLRGAGLSSIEEATIVSDPKKGEFYVAMIEKPGQPAPDVIAEIVPDAIRRFPWPKSMRWGSGSLRWVRPLHSILCVFGPETEETDVVDFEIGGIRSGRVTRGHRFMAPSEIEVRRFDDYVKRLEEAKVILDPARRREIIRTDAKNLAFAQGFDVVEDETLLDEVAGLVEWPVVLMGAFDAGFLDLPPEVVRLTIRNNQKCFVLRGRDSGELADRFLMVANIEAADGGAKIVAGNERVIAARLSDARFFWDQDRKTTLADHATKLGQITFHEKLGTQDQRVERIALLARELAPIAGADPDKAEEAARLCKADLVTGMVGEFPEVQGSMGRYYALAEGIEPEIADAIRDHYRPAGQGDEVPAAPVSIALALADRLDMLVGFWAIDEKPTGSKDPYALRRAALGVIRIVLENGLRLPLAVVCTSTYLSTTAQQYWQGNFFNEVIRPPEGFEDVLPAALIGYEALFDEYKRPTERDAIKRIVARGAILIRAAQGKFNLRADEVTPQQIAKWAPGGLIVADLLAFFADRLKVQLREDGARHDLVDAVFALEGQDDLLMIVRRVEALGAFLETEDGAGLLTAYRRAANILRIEEKKDGRGFAGHANPARFALEEERVLFDRIAEVAAEADSALSREDFAAAMAALAKLRGPVDTFFDEVTVNADDADLRENRLLLLSQIRASMDRVADFSKIGG